MQCDVSLESRQPDQGGGCEADGGGERLVPVAGKPHVEPDYIRPQFSNFTEQTQGVGNSIEIPAADDGKSREFRFRRRQFIGQNCQIQQRVVLELTSDVIPIFIQSATAGRE